MFLRQSVHGHMGDSSTQDQCTMFWFLVAHNCFISQKNVQKFCLENFWKFLSAANYDNLQELNNGIIKQSSQRPWWPTKYNIRPQRTHACVKPVCQLHDVSLYSRKNNAPTLKQYSSKNYKHRFWWHLAEIFKTEFLCCSFHVDLLAIALYWKQSWCVFLATVYNCQ